jgi:hypothetical protein
MPLSHAQRMGATKLTTAGRTPNMAARPSWARFLSDAFLANTEITDPLKINSCANDETITGWHKNLLC